MDSDPICGTAHSVPPKKEDFVLNESNQFKNVITQPPQAQQIIPAKKNGNSENCYFQKKICYWTGAIQKIR